MDAHSHAAAAYECARKAALQLAAFLDGELQGSGAVLDETARLVALAQSHGLIGCGRDRLRRPCEE